VVGYDYSGYGACTGVPSVSNTLADIWVSIICECARALHGLALGVCRFDGLELSSHSVQYMLSKMHPSRGCSMSSLGQSPMSVITRCAASLCVV
jgi:hypothetical protein